jgi:hypothetical protein
VSTIKRVEDLPDWFQSANYKKNLDASDWYREIRKREWANYEIGLAKKNPDAPVNRPLSLFRAMYRELKKDWSLYYKYGMGNPVRDMSKSEALFLAAFNHEDELSKKFFTQSKTLIGHFKNLVRRGDHFAPPEYEDRLAFFMDDWINFDNPNMSDMAYRVVYDTGNAFLEYGRPFEGFPVVIDPTFDDETILAVMKEWLVQMRKDDFPRARRPLNQSDFDDWTFYKIREVHDLDIWASLTGVKIPDRVIAAALWPHAADDFSPIDVLRTTSRKKVKDVFSTYMCARLYGQLTIEQGENFLDE